MKLLALAGTGVVTAEQMAGITSAVTSNIDVVLPVALSLMGIFVGIKIIPRIISTFI